MPDSPTAPMTEHTALPARIPGRFRLDLTHSGINVSTYIGNHALGASFPVVAGLIFYGWRALGVVLAVTASTAAGVFFWSRVGRRGAQLRYDHALWLALLLALTLPAHLFSSFNAAASAGTRTANLAPWPILPAIGIGMVIFIWVLGGTGSGRIHPVLVAHLLLVVLFQDMLVPHYALQRNNALAGDVLNASQPIAGSGTVLRSKQSWMVAPRDPPYEATWSEPASQRLETYTSGLAAPERSWTSLNSLLRDRMPPLEDLIVGGQPAPIGTGSAIGIIIGGLFLLYRGVIDFRIPLLIYLGAMAAFLLLPIPVVITEDSERWVWVAIHAKEIDTGLAVTFWNYEIMASPLLFMAFFLATGPSVRPMAHRARIIFALLVGVVAASFQLYVSVSIGPYLALLGVSLITPTLDKLFPPHPIV